ncbi:MAG: flagellar brake protein [Limnochordia bacterium]|jgi:c-di-GMP-binding flagellar brake protein YcgR
MAQETSLVVGQAISIEFVGEQRSRYKSRIEGISETELYLALPTHRRIPIRFPVGTEIRLSYLSDEPGRGCRWIGETTVKDSIEDGPIPMLIVRHPQVWIRKQDRRHVRVPCHLPVKVYRGEEVFKGQIQDLSGGGMRINLPEPLEPEEIIEVEFCPGPLVRLQAQVVRRIDSQRERGVFALEFVELTDKERDLLIKYVFNLQRELRQKGLL